jgi:G3E family GTPase
MSRETIPVTVLNNLLNARTDLDIAVLVTDMGEVNVDAERFAELLDESPTSVVRSKGYFWLAGREDMALGIDAAGQSMISESLAVDPAIREQAQL